MKPRYGHDTDNDSYLATNRSSCIVGAKWISNNYIDHLQMVDTKEKKMMDDLSQEDKKLIDSATKKQLITWHNAGYNGKPEFWFYVHDTLVKKYPSKDPKYFFDTSTPIIVETDYILTGKLYWNQKYNKWELWYLSDIGELPCCLVR